MRMGGMRSSRAATVGLPAIALMRELLPRAAFGDAGCAAPADARRPRLRTLGRSPPCARIGGMSAPETEARPTTPADITAAVEASFERCADARLREIMQALVRHLHAFAAEVRLTEDEWRAGGRAAPGPGPPPPGR